MIQVIKIIQKLHLQAFLWGILFVCIFACEQPIKQHIPDNNLAQKMKQNAKDTSFINLLEISTDFVYDMRYASSNNFLKEAVYPCDECLLRLEVAKALSKANAYLIKKGMKIILFDCYRPLSVQQKMWDIFPNANYVAQPINGSGSKHNRGGAVDISLLDTKTNKPLDMGTDFDHFEEEAHHSFTELPESILKNRLLLKTTMEKFGFISLNTEWWHYHYKNAETYPLSDFPFSCE